IAYDDLGAEAVRRLEVEDLQLIVAIDCQGNNIYDKRKEYEIEINL
ncbi:MAG: fumarate hydratase C-terminal domain-containing protein, partial [Intestinibacter sp.]